MTTPAKIIAQQVIQENERVRELVRVEVALTIAAYGLEMPAPTTPPVEVAAPAWEEQREHEGSRWGRRLWKFFG
jgi:hypothetical protein